MASGVAVLHPQDVFHQKHHRSSLISPATRSRRRLTNPITPATGANPSAVNSVNPNHTRRSSRKKSPTKKDAFPAKEVTASKAKPKPKSEARPITASDNIKLVMGQVKILRRGETLSSSPPSPPPARSPPASAKISRANTVEESLVFSPPTPADRMMGPPAERNLQQKQIRFSDCYAGLAIDVSSPPPSSVPFPAFFRKKIEDSNTCDATSDLLKLLRLDLA